MYGAILQQGVLLLALGTLPFIWLTLIGQHQEVHLIFNLEITEFMRMAVSTPLNLSLRASGVVSTIGAFLYYKLPLTILPGFIPIVGGIDRTISVMIGLAGICLIIVSYQIV
jgi:uncharacterized membrane protein YkvA (DUF1232 family)